MEELRIDNSKRAAFVECPRKYYWKFIANMTGEYGSTALRYGRVWHVMLHGYYDTIKKQGWGAREMAISNALMFGKKEWDTMSSQQMYYEDFRSFENLCELLLHYVTNYEMDSTNVEIIHTEKIFALDMDLTALEQLLYPDMVKIVFTGKIDLQLELAGLKWVADHKTTGSSIDRVSATMKRDPQFLGYTYASRRVLDFVPTGFLVSMSMSSSRKNKDGVYGKLTVDFRRIPQLYSEGDLESWRRSFIHTCSQIQWCEEHHFWPMNHNSCYNYNKDCSFTRLCEQNKEPSETNTDGFMVLPWDVETEGGLPDVE